MSLHSKLRVNKCMTFDTTNWQMEKVLTIEQAFEVAENLRGEGKKLVTVNGSFDLLHAGHLDQLEEAKQQGDILFVGINTDESIQAEKGADRPLQAQEARAAMLAALTCVDYVVLMPGAYDEEPHASFLPAINPDVHVNGPDRGAPETWVEWPTMRELGVSGHTITKRNDLSTSALIDKIISS